MPELRRLGRSDLSTPRLVLGGNVFGWTADAATSFRTLDRFAEAGGLMIDTADVYSAWVEGHRGGESETIIGEWIRRRGGTRGVLIATKVGMLPGEGGEKLAPARIAAAAEASLKRLGVDTIDLYYAHQDDPETPIDDVLQVFDALVRDGKVRTLGASNFTAERLEESLAAASRLGTARYEVLQPEYHLMAREDVERALQPLCVSEDISILPYYGLASGFLTGKYRRREDFGQSVRGGRMERFWNARGFAVLEALDAVAAEARATPAQVALAWLAAQPAVAAPIASARTPEQLEELLPAMTLELTADQRARLDAASRS
ncbi:aldo/keto reductase [Sphingosinicella sp. BN140058]|uniref:aldo/keto reductase n=1 Tax=Sphingosinicella sp. BN140058 TaxID=1892855 RepID=UPI001012B1A3|nr:aldo/keto reductase [Sphingosinicella sp. BN140058]QAY76218.1 aldo/keto reductase [Sphingosinicella sp. BN140058]